MEPKKLYTLMIVIMVVLLGINLASAQELGRKGAAKSRYGIGLSIGNHSYLDSDFFKNHPEGLEPGDLRGNSYNIQLESTPYPGIFGVELLVSVDSSSTEAPKTGNNHKFKPLNGRLSGKVHPLATTGMSRYFDFYVGGGATGVSFNYQTTDINDSYKAFGPHAIAGVEYYLGTFSNGRWGWGAYFDYIFTSVNIERVKRDTKNLEDRPNLNAGGHLFLFGVRLNAVR